MKLLFALASLAVVCILGAKDPTTICLPEVLETDVYLATSDDFGRVAIDFKNEVIGIVYVRSGLRVVLNLTTFEGSAINITDGKCQKTAAGADISHVVTRCLPASARQITNSTRRIGIAPNSVEVEEYEIEIGTGITRVILTTGDNVVPVLREYRSGKTREVAFYDNPSLTIRSERIFHVPDDCEPASIVG